MMMAWSGAFVGQYSLPGSIFFIFCYKTAHIYVMVLCAHNCKCDYCILIATYSHPRFKRDVQVIMEKYKLFVNPNYFPIEIVEDE